jgi:cytochrome c biogenesis protein CcmG, thiol:disulfide interchange protein DsbE
MTDFAQTPQDPYADEYASAPSEERSTQGWRIKPGGIVLILGAVLLTVVVAYGIYQNEQSTLIDGPAPDFSLNIYDSNNIAYADNNAEMVFSGEELRLSNLEGPVVLNFWRTNCPPCHDEAPMLTRVYADYRDDGVEFIGINVKDPDTLAYNYLARYGITYPNGLDRADTIQEAYRTSGQPETFVIGADGNIRAHWSGPPTEAQLRAALDDALAAS